MMSKLRSSWNQSSKKFHARTSFENAAINLRMNEARNKGMFPQAAFTYAHAARKASTNWIIIYQ